MNNLFNPSIFTGGQLLRELRVKGERINGSSISMADVSGMMKELAEERGIDFKGGGENNYWKYENDKRSPQRVTLELILDSLATMLKGGISFGLRLQALILFGYEHPRLPPTSEIKNEAVRYYKEMIESESFNHPAYLLDNTLTILYLNSHFKKLSGVYNNPQKERLLLDIPLYQALYHPKLRFFDRMVNPKVFLPISMAVLVYEYENSGRASWFWAKIEEAISKYPEFESIWLDTLKGTNSMPQPSVPLIAEGIDNAQIKYRVNKDEWRNDNRFRLIYYQPF